MDKEQIISTLTNLNFSRLEAEIYITLLEGEMSGYQISKKIEIARPSVYAALEHMFEKGIVQKVQDNSSVYKAQPPKVIFKKLSEEFSENAFLAEEVLTQYSEYHFENRIFTIKGIKTIIEYAKDMIIKAKNEVFINTDLELSIFKTSIKKASENGTAITIFSFYEPDIDLPCKIFTHNRKNKHTASRLMLSYDDSETLIANANDSWEWLASITNNPLLVEIITEHIHNDIYLLKLRNEYGSEIYNNLRIGSNFESHNKIVK
ncbi:MAG: hypothetical protein MR300_05950 [Ruminococcus sp.]|nr:hypothetical protein [Ruminococcus sp.]